MDIGEFKTVLFELAKNAGFQDWELYYNRASALQVKVFQKEIAQYTNADVIGVSFRGVYGGKMGYAYSEAISEEAARTLVEGARENAGVVEQSGETLYASNRRYEGSDPMVSKISNITPEKLIEGAMAMEKMSYEADPRVISVDHSIAGRSVGQVYIANSHGMDLRYESGHAIGFVVARLMEKEQTKMGGEIWCGKDFDQFNPETLSKKAVAKAAAALGAVIPAGKKCGVIIKNEAAIDLLSGFVSRFYGETVQKGFSLFRGRLGKDVASKAVTIRDVPAHPLAVETLVFDSEGVFVQEKTVVDKGRLNCFLYNLKAAAKDGAPPTGNGFKPSFKSAVDTSAANFYIEPSETTEKELIKELGEGFIITDLSGLHSGINVISGDFSLGAEGFMVTNGKLGGPVEQITIAGNFYDLLKDIQAVGSDLKFDTPGSGGSIGSPSLLIKVISVSGK